MRVLLFLSGSIFTLGLHAQALSTASNIPRSGDQLIKHVVTTCEPGDTGSGQIWDFSNLKLQDASYELKYTTQGSDSIVATEHRTMYYYLLSGDSLFCLGYENPTTSITYQKPELLLSFPVVQDRAVSDYFDGEGNYCGHLHIRQRGKSTITADASGDLILPESDTLRKVLRIRTHKLIHQRMTPKENASASLQPDILPYTLNRDSIEHLLANDSIHLETETWRWYAHGYRYPVVETVKSTVYQYGNPHEHFSTSFIYLPEEQYYDLPYDANNQKRRDIATEEQVEREWRNTVKTGKKGRNDDIISYNYELESGGDLQVSYELKQPEKVTISLFNLQGQQLTIIQRTSPTAGLYSETIPMDSYPAGKYLLRITSGKKVYAEKILKK